MYAKHYRRGIELESRPKFNLNGNFIIRVDKKITKRPSVAMFVVRRKFASIQSARAASAENFLELSTFFPNWPLEAELID